MQPVTNGPIDIGPTPIEVRFLAPVVAQGTRRELCFEFEHARDSHRASEIRVTLLKGDGRKEAFGGKIDRRGEALVCLVNTGSTLQGAAPALAGLEYRAVELSSTAPVRLRGLCWASGE